MKPLRAVCLAVMVALSAGLSSHDQNENFHPRVPTVTFDQLWEQAIPQEFIVTTRADGGSTYLSRNPTKPVASGEEKEPDYTLEFTLSQRNQNRVFKLAQDANYFNGDFEYKAHAVASTGRKTLTYADESRHFQTVFNHSEVKPISELTSLFEGISATIEHGRKLAFAHKYDKLGLEAELKAMEDAETSHFLDELQIIAPTLQSIADDKSVMNIARQRAKRLLDRANAQK